MSDLNINIAQNKDAFARLRVSNPQTIFDSKQIGDNQPLFWDDEEVSGTGTSSTYNTNQASTTLSVGASTAGKRIRQTFRKFNYQTGKSQLVLLTGVLGAPATGITRRIGQFDNNNGYMFISSPTSFAVGIRTFTSGVASDNIVNQSSFNLDKLDGTGTSGFTIDLSKTNIYFFDYQWLGVGAVRFGVVIDGKPVYCHQFNHANILTLVYTSTPNLPLRFEIENDGTGAASNLVHICSSVITEGGRADTGVIRGLNRADNSLTTNNDALIYPLIGLRLKAGYLGAFVRYIDHQIICTSTAEYAWYVILKPTITGTAPTWLDLTNSSIQYCFPTNTTTISDGIVLATGLGSDTVQNKAGVQALVQSELAIGADINDVPDEIYLGVQRIVGTTETFYSSINFSETI
jgi:hypothetical protein